MPRDSTVPPECLSETSRSVGQYSAASSVFVAQGERCGRFPVVRFCFAKFWKASDFGVFGYFLSNAGLRSLFSIGF